MANKDSALPSVNIDNEDRIVLSIVSPVYRAENIVDELVRQVCLYAAQATSNFEFILVEDGSPDNSWEKIKANALKIPNVRGIKLSRNFGQHNAVRAGVETATGDYVVVMDCDLQDDPKYIPELLERAQAGFDIVFTRKGVRKHSSIKNFFSYLFHWGFNRLTDTHKIDPNLSGYSIMSRKAVDAFCRFCEPNKAYISILQWMGFPYATIDVVHKERFEGKSSYSFQTLLRHAMTGLLANSDKLLWFSIYLAFSLFVASFATTGLLVARYFIFGAKPGWTSLVVIVLLCTGMIMFGLGILGLYIGKIFELSKGRPLFLIDQEVGFRGENKVKFF